MFYFLFISAKLVGIGESCALVLTGQGNGVVLHILIAEVITADVHWHRATEVRAITRVRSPRPPCAQVRGKRGSAKLCACCLAALAPVAGRRARQDGCSGRVPCAGALRGCSASLPGPRCPSLPCSVLQHGSSRSSSSSGGHAGLSHFHSSLPRIALFGG